MTQRLWHTQALLITALWGIGLAIGVAGVSQLTPEPADPTLDAKVAHLEQNRARYDTLFFGSSRIFRGIDPLEFDHEMAARGNRTRSFNFAFRGMRAHETNALLRRVLARRPEGLRFVFVELAEWEPGIIARDTARAVAWHDATETISALHTTLLASGDLRRKFDLLLGHLSHFARRMLRIGRAADHLRARISGDDALDSSFPRRGYQPYGPSHHELGQTAKNRSAFLDDLATYDAWIAAAGGQKEDAEAARILLTHKPMIRPESYNLPALERQRERIQRAGATPVFLIPPFPSNTEALEKLVADKLPAVFAFNDPARSPQLFRPQHRFDLQHLNTRGARIFSRRVAAKFAAWLETR